MVAQCSPITALLERVESEVIRPVKRNTREKTEQIMGEDDGLQEAGEGVIENNHKQEEATDKCVCVCTSDKVLLQRKKKKKNLSSVFPCHFL